MCSLLFMSVLLICYVIFKEQQKSIEFVIEYVEKAIVLFSTYSFSDKFTKENEYIEK